MASHHSVGHVRHGPGSMAWPSALRRALARDPPGSAARHHPLEGPTTSPAIDRPGSRTGAAVHARIGDKHAGARERGRSGRGSGARRSGRSRAVRRATRTPLGAAGASGLLHPPRGTATARRVARAASPRRRCRHCCRAPRKVADADLEQVYVPIQRTLAFQVALHGAAHAAQRHQARETTAGATKGGNND